jgi:hypothetical protein
MKEYIDGLNKSKNLLYNGDALRKYAYDCCRKRNGSEGMTIVIYIIVTGI